MSNPGKTEQEGGGIIQPNALDKKANRPIYRKIKLAVNKGSIQQKVNHNKSKTPSLQHSYVLHKTEFLYATVFSSEQKKRKDIGINGK